jgi:putative adenylate-forming enzyme
VSLLGSILLAPWLRWRFYAWSADRLFAYQERRIRTLIGSLAERSPYYRDRIAPDTPLDEVPTMDKATMMAQFDAINTAGLRRDELVAFRIRQEHEGARGLYRGGYAVGLSSGTSGNKVLTVLSPRERDRYAALLWARSGLRWRRRPPRVLFALRTRNEAFQAVRRFGVTLVHVDYLQSPETLVRLVNEHRLNVLAGPPSILTLLAERRERIRGRIDALISYAEELDDAGKRRLEEAFDAPVAEIYQGAEGMIASTCRAGRLHLNEDAVRVELDPAGDVLGDAGAVVVTDLHRTTQPFVRYRLGDLLELGGRDCPCGSSFRIVERIHGRSDGTFVLAAAGGGRVLLMPDYVRRSINRASQDVEEYQAIQHATDDVEIRLRLAPGSDRAAIEAAIAANLAMWCERAGGEVPAVRFPDRRPERNPRSGKLIRVVRTFA